MRLSRPGVRQLCESFCRFLFLLSAFSFSPAVAQQNIIVFSSMDECPTASRPRQLQANSKALNWHFLTPGFHKGSYQPNMDCHWVVSSSSQRHRIQLLVHKSDIEDRLFTDCDDFLEIKDGASMNSALISKWCGVNNPLSMTSSMNKMYIHFKSDESGQRPGTNMSFIEYEIPGCPPGWRSIGELCYQLFSPKTKVTWLQAQRHCINDRSNLVSITSQEEYTNLLSNFATEAAEDPPWIGYHDAKEENKFESVNPTVTPWPSPFPQFEKAHEFKDCIYLDLTDSDRAYNVDDCRKKRSFICKKRKDGTTASYPPPEDAIRQGLIGTAGIQGPIWLWLLILVVFLLLLLILIPVCVRKYKRRKSRVHSANRSLLRIEKLEETYDNQEPHVRSVSRMVEGSSTDLLGQTAETTVHLGNGSVIPNGHNHELERIEQSFDQNERELTEKVEPAETVESSRLGPTRPLPPILHNGHMANGRPKTGVRNGGGLAPLDRFDRPHIRLLDNVSAISLDEFWNKVDSKKIKHVQVAPEKDSVTET